LLHREGLKWHEIPTFADVSVELICCKEVVGGKKTVVLGYWSFTNIFVSLCLFAQGRIENGMLQALVSVSHTSLARASATFLLFGKAC
jgi:hypothetical protein